MPFNNAKPALIAFAAPSGAGKTTIVRHLLKTMPDRVAFSISATTRKPRGHEVDGKDYYFLSEKLFKQRIETEQFVEYEEVYPGRYYGTLKREVNRILDSGRSVIFDIDVKGALSIKQQFPDDTIIVFVLPPNEETLFDRLRLRGTETEEQLRPRFDRARWEISQASKFDVILLNDQLDEALLNAEQLITDITTNGHTVHRRY